MRWRPTSPASRTQYHSGPVSFCRETPRDKGFQAVVGAGGPLIGGEADGGLVGGTVE